jgi:cytochrome b subunit of formate dehydrogenase
MNRTKANYYVDLILTLLFIMVLITGLVMYLVIPGGVRHGRYQEYLGLTKASWTLIHNRSAILMTAMVGLHLVLHKKWIGCATRNILTRNNNKKCELADQE